MSDSNGFATIAPSWDWIVRNIDEGERCQRETCRHGLGVHGATGCFECNRFHSVASTPCNAFVLHRDLYCQHRSPLEASAPSGVTYKRCRWCDATETVQPRAM